MNNEEKILALLEKQDTRFEKIEAQLAEQGKQLAEQGERLRKIEMTQENRILPSLRVLAEGQSDILKQFAKNESVAEARGTANFALSLIKDHTEKISDLTDRVGALEKAN